MVSSLILGPTQTKDSTGRCIWLFEKALLRRKDSLDNDLNKKRSQDESSPFHAFCTAYIEVLCHKLALALSWDSRLSNNTAGSFINWMLRSLCFDRDHEGQLLLRWLCLLDEHGHHTEELLYSSVLLWSTSTLKTVQWTCISGRDGRDGHVRRMCGMQCAALYCRDCFQACCVNCVNQKPIAWSKLKWNKHLCHLNAKKEYLRHQWQHEGLDSLTLGRSGMLRPWELWQGLGLGKWKQSESIETESAKSEQFLKQNVSTMV